MVHFQFIVKLLQYELGLYRTQMNRKEYKSNDEGRRPFLWRSGMKFQESKWYPNASGAAQTSANLHWVSSPQLHWNRRGHLLVAMLQLGISMLLAFFNSITTWRFQLVRPSNIRKWDRTGTSRIPLDRLALTMYAVFELAEKW